MKKTWVAVAGVAMAAGFMAPPAAAAVGPPTCGPFPPHFTVANNGTGFSGIFGGCFHTGAPITIRIDDPGTVVNPDVTIDGGVSDQGGSFNTTLLGIMIESVRPGETVTVDDANGFTITHVVTGLTVTSVDAGDETVSGTADPGSRVVVSAAFHWPRDGFASTEPAGRVVVADGAGHFDVDFTAAGLSGPDDQGTHDLRPGSGVWASQINPDPPAGWPGPSPFPVALWGAVNQTWVIRQLQPQHQQDCKQGRWAYVVDSAGFHFKNQGDCVSFVASGGKNLGDGGPF
jgi:hypothetical protein